MLDQDISRLVKANLKTSTSTALGQSLECKSVCSAELGWTCQCLPPRFLPMIHLVSSCFMSSSKSTSGPVHFATCPYFSVSSGLERGRHYKVCADMDGVGSLQMVDTLREAGQGWYIRYMLAYLKLGDPETKLVDGMFRFGFRCPRSHIVIIM